LQIDKLNKIKKKTQKASLVFFFLASSSPILQVLIKNLTSFQA
jgi:hypothetical protein